MVGVYHCVNTFIRFHEKRTREGRQGGILRLYPLFAFSELLTTPEDRSLRDFVTCAWCASAPWFTFFLYTVNSTLTPRGNIHFIPINRDCVHGDVSSALFVYRKHYEPCGFNPPFEFYSIKAQN